MCPLGSHVIHGHTRICASGTATWVDAHIRKNPKKIKAGYLSENLLYLYWNSTKEYPTLPDIVGFKGRNEYDRAIQFWIDYWKERGLPFPSDLDPLMIKAMVAVESGFNPKAKSTKSTAGGLLQLLDLAIRTLWGVPDHKGWIDVKNERVHVLYKEKFDPVVNIALAVRFLSYKFTKIRPPLLKNSEGMLTGYNQFNLEGQKYAKRVLQLYSDSLKNSERKQ